MFDHSSVLLAFLLFLWWFGVAHHQTGRSWIVHFYISCLRVLIDLSYYLAVCEGSVLKIIPVILSGGVGSRLWPLSREHFPKQCLPLTDKEYSLLQQTMLRTLSLDVRILSWCVMKTIAF